MKMIRHEKTLFPAAATLVAWLALSLAAPVASADTYEVNKRGDHAPGNCTADDCTLREAVIAATGHVGNDKITLKSRKPYRLTRSANLPGLDDVKGDLDVGNAVNEADNALKIIHPGAGKATIDAAKADDRAIHYKGVLKLKKVRIRRGEVPAGNAGGGVFGAGQLTLNRVKVRNNESGWAGGGVSGNGVLAIKRSEISGNTSLAGGGGGIRIEGGVATIKRTLIRNNSGSAGGGILVSNEALADLIKSTVRGNTSSGVGGGIQIRTSEFFGSPQITASTISGNQAADDGGGIYNEAGDLRIDNSTVTKNKASERGGGIFAGPTSLAIINGATIARNRSDSDNSGGASASGGGVYADGGADVIEIRNSLLVKNHQTGGAINECDAPAPIGVDSQGGNLITSDAGGCDFFDHAEDIIDPNPGISQLKDKGGPTLTIPILSGSPAINQADGANPLTRDQRGKLRQNPDIGAYER